MEDAKILWISDIHFKHEYSDLTTRSNSNAKKIISDFIKEIKKIDGITHVVFTGDLVYDGNNKSYAGLKDIFYNPLKEILKGIPYISVPGNHDVKWINVKNIYDNSGKKAMKFFNRSILAFDEKVYSNVIEDFKSESNHIKGVILPEKTDRFVDKVDPEGNYGYFFDKKYNLLYIVINSAWFSFGEVPKGQVFKDIKEGMVFHGIKDTFSTLMGLDDKLLSENGNQTYGWSLFKEKGLLNEIKAIIKNSDTLPFIISVAHHPPSWLDWREKYTESALDDPYITELSSISNLHLVGHEHSTPSWGNVLQGNCLMLHAGKFMDESIEKKIERGFSAQLLFPNNWFSILEIKQGKLVHKGYRYTQLRGETFQWEESIIHKYNYNRDKSISFLKNIENPICNSDSIKSENPNLLSTINIEEMPVNFDYSDFINRNIFLNKAIKNVTSFDKEMLSDKLTVYLSNVEPNTVRFFYQNNSNLDFDDYILDDLIQNINNWITKNESKQVDCIIIALASFYRILSDCEPKSVRVETLPDFEKLHRIMDIKYNTFKHKFFERLVNSDYQIFRKLHDVNFTFKLIDVEK